MQSNWITTKRKGYIGLMRGLMALSTALLLPERIRGSRFRWV